MAFPSTPINEQIVVVNNIVYKYDSASTAWYRTGETSANLIVADSANIIATTSSVSTTTGALRVAGGAGIAGNVVVGAVYTDSYFYANGTPYSTAGALGYTGSAGEQGTTGYTGSTGTNGTNGTNGADGYTGSKGDTGLGFKIAKSYATLSALLADTAPTGIVAGEFALIETGNVEDADNSKLYLWTGTTYTYVSDLSGAAGITGPAGSIGYTGSASTVAGYTGSAGADGIMGVDGYTGSIGYSGSSGVDGYTGSIGYSGSSGTTGYTGSVGSIGYTGSQGTNGTIGVDGYTGSQGVSGYTGSVGLLDWTPITANYAVANRERLLLNSSAGAFTLTLPATPATGTYIQLTDGANLATNNVIVDRNGSTIENLSTNLVLDVPNATFEFIYDGATWQFTSTSGPRGEVGYTGSVGTTGYTGSLGELGYTGSTGAGYTGSVGLLDWTPISANHNAANRERLMLNTSAGPFTLTLPATPATGTYIQLTDGANLATNNVTIARNGSTIENLSEDLALDTPNATFEFIYDGATWQVTSTAGPRGLVGYTGSAGSDGVIGYNGSVGYTGSAGSDGVIGYNGSVGYTGSKGDTGLGFTIAKSYASLSALTADTAPIGIVAGQFALIETGNVEDADNSKLYLWTGSTYTYVTDLSGAAGITGPQGTLGYTGSQGAPGTDGTSGTDGSTGFTGSTGDIGFTGSQGAPGTDGTSGTDGSTGFTGSTGDIGFTGSRGFQGETGYIGSQGIAGEAAAIGYTGSTGYVGSAGTPGSQGQPGIATSSLLVDNFTGTGSQVEFALTVTPTGVNQTSVNIDGVSQIRNTYSVVDNILTFSEAPAAGASIEVTIFVYGTASFVTRIYTGDGSTTNFTVTSGVTADSVLVSDNGIVQRPVTDYFVSGLTLTFVTAPLSGSSVQIREIPAGSIGYTGSAGAAGTSGIDGYTGSIGGNGYTGSQGDLGYTGSASTVVGYTGSQGELGYTGTDGVNGYTGSAGIDGTAGYTGSASTIPGYTGSTGIGYTGSSGALSAWIKKTANYTAASSDRIIADSSAGSFTITLPAAPVLGDYVKITDGSNFAINSITVAANGNTIENQSSDVDIDIGSVDLEFIYDGATWQIVSTAGPTGSVGYTGSAGSLSGTVSGNLSVSGTSFFTGDILPTSNNTVNIGSPTQRFGTLYLSANTIDLGGATISTTPTGDLSFVTSSGSVDITANTVNFLNTVANTTVAPGELGPVGYTGSVGPAGYTGSSGTGSTGGGSKAVAVGYSLVFGG